MNAAELTGGTLILAALISIALGIANCFFGYRIFRVLLGIIGFVAGAAGGLAIVQALIAERVITTSGPLLYQILGVLIGGALGAVLLIFVYFIGIFLLGALMGLLIGTYAAQALSAGDDVTLIAGIVLALVGGVLALIIQRVIIIIATSISGAYSIVWGLALLVSPRTATRMLSGQAEMVESAPVLLLVGWVVLAIAGMVVQFAVTGKKKPQPTAAAGAAVGAAAAGAVPQVVVQQYNVPGQPAPQPPPIIPAPQAQAAQPLPPPTQYTVPPLPAPVEEVQSFPTPAAGGSKFCPQCGQPVAYGATFCTGCGSSVEHLWQ